MLDSDSSSVTFTFPHGTAKELLVKLKCWNTYFFVIYYQAVISPPARASPSTPRFYFTLSRKSAKPQLHTLLLAIFIITGIFLTQE